MASFRWFRWFYCSTCERITVPTYSTDSQQYFKEHFNKTLAIRIIIKFANSIVRVKCDKQIEFLSQSLVFRYITNWHAWKLHEIVRGCVHTFWIGALFQSKFHESEELADTDWNSEKKKRAGPTENRISKSFFQKKTTTKQTHSIHIGTYKLTGTHTHMHSTKTITKSKQNYTFWIGCTYSQHNDG